MTSIVTRPVLVSIVPMALTFSSRPILEAYDTVSCSAADRNACGSELLPASRRYETPSRAADCAVLRA